MQVGTLNYKLRVTMLANSSILLAEVYNNFIPKLKIQWHTVSYIYLHFFNQNDSKYKRGSMSS